VDAPAPYAEVAPIVRALNSQLRGSAERLERERRFFAEAAHELRTPLAVLSAQAHVVANEDDPIERRRALVALESGIDRSARVVQRLLTLARLDAKQPGERLEPMDLGELVEETVATLTARAEASGHRLDVDASPVILLGSEEALRAALENLIDNALRYTPAGTTIDVSVTQRAGVCHLVVADDGPGIPAEHQGRVFERFERLGRCSDEGTGLGLAIVRRVAELHGGEAAYEPGEGGRGCRFSLRLPIRSGVGMPEPRLDG
jgi:signal transduction histidine kinase